MMLNLEGSGPSGGQLNKELSAQTQAKKPLFSVPFGDKTVFHTKQGGVVIVTFIFDPDHPYTSSFNTASITSDYLSEMRKELTRLLLEAKDIKPLKPTREEATWNHIRATVPKEVLTEYFKENKHLLQEYINILKKDAEQDYDEDTKLTEAMQKDFTFKYQVAIDAYPSQMDKNSSRRSTSEMEVPTGRKGVLTFYIQGMCAATKNGNLASSPTTDDYPQLMVDFDTITNNDSKNTNKKHKEPTTTNSTTSSSSEQPKKKIKVDDEADDIVSTTPNNKPTLKRVATILPKALKRGNASMKEWKKLVQRLGLTDLLLNKTQTFYQKEFFSASEFFDAVDKWFTSTVDVTATHLKLKEQKASSHQMYN